MGRSLSAAPASGSLLERQNLGPHSRPNESESPFNKIFRRSVCVWKWRSTAWACLKSLSIRHHIGSRGHITTLTQAWICGSQLINESIKYWPLHRCPLLCQGLLVIFFYKRQDMIPVESMLTILLEKENIHMLRVTFQKSKSDPITALSKMTAYPSASQMKSRLQQSIGSLCTVWCMPSFLPVLSIATLSPVKLNLKVLKCAELAIVSMLCPCRMTLPLPALLPV